MSDLTRRATTFAALADATRLWIVDLLVLGDLSSTEIQAALGLPSNLVAHHVRVLEKAGILTRARSEFDGRRTYLHLVRDAFDSLIPGPLTVRGRVVFVCTANSARSQLAEALWRRSSSIPALSAGMSPAAEVNPGAVAAARRHGFSLDGAARPRHVDDVIVEGDFVISVCDGAHEQLRGDDDLHWSIPDPAALGTEAAFDETVLELTDRIDVVAGRLQPA
ncbi:helix-turn-helix domain-containing protein [Herbiconiux sp. P18]|uniref:arsenate reductase/protein-tyrosine-phosphatase family protein n=1 Tax=Herbiconiux liangxiaofengii TaxID=3342795 RepID=UPI0035BB452A